MPALNDAISQKRFKQAYLLINYGINLNTRNFVGKTALMQLCELKPEGTAVVLAKALVKRGAHIDKVDRKGRNSLMYAILNQRERLLSYFLEEAFNYDLNAKDFDGNTALLHAAMIGNSEIIRQIVRLLRKFRLSVDVSNNNGETPLIQAKKLGHIACAKIILYEGKASEHMRDNISWKTASEWEGIFRLEKQQKLEYTRSMSSAKGFGKKEARRSKSVPNESKSNLDETRPKTSQSLVKPKHSQRQELERLFDVYKDQFSSTYRIGHTATRKRQEIKNLTCSLETEVEDDLEDANLAKSSLSEVSTRRLFAKGTAIVKFKRGSSFNLRSQVSKTNCLPVSFSPYPTKPDNKLSPTKADSPRNTFLSRPSRPVRSRSEIPHSILSWESAEKTFPLHNNKLPMIPSQERRKIDLTISTVLEDEEPE